MRFDANVRLIGLLVLATAMPSLADAQSGPAASPSAVESAPDQPSAPIVAPAVPPAAPRPTPVSPLKSVVKELRSGPLLIHGNFCGIGNRPGKLPIDALDAACMRHDACTKTGKLPSCACDDRLRIEATAIAESPRTPPDLKLVASATASAMAVLICKTGGTVAVPILPVTR